MLCYRAEIFTEAVASVASMVATPLVILLPYSYVVIGSIGKIY